MALPPNIKIFNYDTLLKQSAEGWVYKGKPFNGYMVQEEINHRIVYELPIINGWENGLAKGCYYDGVKLLERFYTNGKKEGSFKQWWRNGNYRYLFHYKNDKYEGSQLVFFPDGSKRQESTYQNGDEEGIQRIWNEQGILISNYTIKNKRQYGIIKVKSCIPATH
ncbi:toxin-antitoxin system YwqK family antitoxin [Ferruginibacter sp.]|uniref:toxin-antitoxin system YwqK family antitoxin n=1 Tax=Ferruginibacter sp. TaxID=1940288 RepID=UPI002659D8B6|nr:hypothetical protein [Ferruginibacter sp.]